MSGSAGMRAGRRPTSAQEVAPVICACPDQVALRLQLRVVLDAMEVCSRGALPDGSEWPDLEARPLDARVNLDTLQGDLHVVMRWIERLQGRHRCPPGAVRGAESPGAL